MTNKELIKEIIWLFVGLTITFVAAMLIIPTSDRSFYLSDIYLGSQPSATVGIIGKLTSSLAYLLALLLLFPALFIIQTIRGAVNKFSSRSFNIYLGFICFFSLLISILILITCEPIMILLAGSYTFYPPLSALSETGSPPESLRYVFFSAIIFIVIQVAVLALIAGKLVKGK